MVLQFRIRSLGNLKLIKEKQSFMMSLLFVLNSFMRKLNMAKSNEYDRISDCDKRQTLVAYRRISMHCIYYPLNGLRHLPKPVDQLFQKRRLFER